ncbi:MAG: serine/threonine protein kinase [Deltaproteobacteria bacterium]|nr:MAG: serine/threonine protein kinase [Deltaproteobacteria bacterium]
MNRSSVEIKPGYELEDCVILGKIGHGKMAEVFKAIQIIVPRPDLKRLVDLLLRTSTIEHQLIQDFRRLERLQKVDKIEFLPEIKDLKGEITKLKEKLSRGNPVHNTSDVESITAQSGLSSYVRLVAAKYLSYERANSKEENITLEDFEKEMRLHSLLNHENIVQVYRSVRTRDGLWIIEELVDGTDLNSILGDQRRMETQPEPLDPLVVLSIGYYAALGLDHIHSRGVVNRDIKPENMIVGYTGGAIKIADFGSAERYYPDSDEFQTSDVFSTSLAYASPMIMDCADFNAAGEFVGMKPGKKIILDPRDDIYSLGVTMYKLLAARLPFVSPSGRGDHLVYLIRKGKTNSLRDYNPLITNEIQKIVAKCIKRDPKKRYQTARELASDISNYLRKGGILLAEYKSVIHDFMRYAREEREHFYHRSTSEVMEQSVEDTSVGRVDDSRG